MNITHKRLAKLIDSLGLTVAEEGEKRIAQLGPAYDLSWRSGRSYPSCCCVQSTLMGLGEDYIIEQGTLFKVAHRSYKCGIFHRPAEVPVEVLEVSCDGLSVPLEDVAVLVSLPSSIPLRRMAGLEKWIAIASEKEAQLTPSQISTARALRSATNVTVTLNQ